MVKAIQFPVAAGLRPSAATACAHATKGAAFPEVLAHTLGKSGEVRLSAHAQQRLEQRGIALDEGQMTRLSEAVDAAQAKGSQESLVLLDEVALVVSIPNRTVITAMATEDNEAAVFTNIDSAVVAQQAPPHRTQVENYGPAPFKGGPSAADRLTRRLV